MIIIRNKFIFSLILFFVINNHGLFSQNLAGAEGHSSQYDDFLYDFMIHDDSPFQLLSENVLTYPQIVYASMIRSPFFTINPMYLGNEYSNLKFVQDTNENVYITGIYSQTGIIDTTFLIICKLDKFGSNIWTRSFQKYSDCISIFIDNFNYVYIHDNHFLYKLNSNGLLIWKKPQTGVLKLFTNSFYKIQGINFNDSLNNSHISDSLILSKLDTSGNQLSQYVLNRCVTDSSEISDNFSFNIIGGKIILSNSYWGKIDVNPTGTGRIFENYNKYTDYWGIKVPLFYNYFAVYDTLGNLSLANSKDKMPRINYACQDSSGNFYFSGPSYNKADFILNHNDDSLIIVKSLSDRSFLAKYSNDLEIIWSRNMTGLIKYIGTSRYPTGNIEKLDVAGEYNGTINLDFKLPNRVTFTSQKQDLFYAKYVNLNDNISLTSINTPEYRHIFLIYPNPATNYITLEYMEKASIEILNIEGQVIKREKINDNKINIDISNFANGVYIIRALTDKGITTKKFIKE
jgi:hypothetical protein